MENKKDFGGSALLDELMGTKAPAAQQTAPKAPEAPEAKAQKLPSTRLAKTEADRRRMAKQAAQNMQYHVRRERPQLLGEARSRRLQLLIRPSLWEAMQRLADIEGKSFNQMAERAFTAFVEANTPKE